MEFIFLTAIWIFTLTKKSRDILSDFSGLLFFRNSFLLGRMLTFQINEKKINEYGERIWSWKLRFLFYAKILNLESAQRCVVDSDNVSRIEWLNGKNDRSTSDADAVNVVVLRKKWLSISKTESAKNFTHSNL